MNDIPMLKDEDIILAETQRMRERVLDALMPTNTVPTDEKQLGIILTTLSDMDRSALSRKKIKSDEKIVNNQEAAAGLIGEVLMRAAANKAYLSDVPVNRNTPVLPSHIPDPVLVPGETSIGTSNETYTTFMDRVRVTEQSE